MEIKSTVDSLSRLGPIAPNVVIILSASSCDFWQSPWEIGSATAERAGQGEVGGCTRRVQTAWPCLGSAVERSWSALGGSFPSFLAQMGSESSRLALQGLHFQHASHVFQLQRVAISLEA